MVEASSVYFQSVKELAAHVKIVCVSRWCWHGPYLCFLLLSDVFRLPGFYEWKSKGFGSIGMIFFSIFVNFSSQDLKGHI